jgi:thiol-disulfide isomerase/thioredoxin
MLELPPVVLDTSDSTCALRHTTSEQSEIIMRRFVPLSLFLVVTASIWSFPAQGQDLGEMLDTVEKETALENKDIFQDPYKILQASIEKLKDVQTVRYNSHLKGRGADEAMMPELAGTVLIQTAPELPIPFRFRSDGTMTIPDAPDEVRFTTAYDGKKVFALDYDQSKLLVGDLMTGGTDLLAGTTELLRDVFVNPEPYSEELKAQKLEYMGFAKDVFGYKCYVVKVTFSDEFSIRWFIAFDDLLPRRMDRIFQTPDGEVSVRYFIKDLEVNPTISLDDFAIATPEGFAQEQYDNTGLLPVGSLAPDWTLKDIDGQTVSLSDFRGQVVLMDFWATWCGPCKIAMPGVQKISESFADKGVKVLGIQTWDEGKYEEGKAYMRKQGFTYTNLIAGDDVADVYQVTGIPTFYVIGRDGTIIYRMVGAADESVLHQFLEDYLSDES